MYVRLRGVAIAKRSPGRVPAAREIGKAHGDDKQIVVFKIPPEAPGG